MEKKDMGTFARGITLIQYKILGHEVTDKVLLIQSDGQFHMHALSINLVGTGRNYAEAMDALEDLVAYQINLIEQDPDHYLIVPAPDSLFQTWEKIRETTLNKAKGLDLPGLSQYPTEVRIPVAV